MNPKLARHTQRNLDHVIKFGLIEDDRLIQINRVILRAAEEVAEEYDIDLEGGDE